MILRLCRIIWEERDITWPFKSCFQISNPRVTTFEIFDPGVAQCGNTVLQSGTQSHSSHIFIQVQLQFQPPRENGSHSICLNALPVFQVSSLFGFAHTNNFHRILQLFSEQSLFFIHKFLPSAPLSCAGLSKKDQAKPISCECKFWRKWWAAPSSISSKPAVTHSVAHTGTSQSCVFLLFSKPPLPSLCMAGVPVYCPCKK